MSNKKGTYKINPEAIKEQYKVDFKIMLLYYEFFISEGKPILDDLSFCLIISNKDKKFNEELKFKIEELNEKFIDKVNKMYN